MISVIIPTYNSEKTIADCIRALGEQTAKNREIIVVDDGSKDRTSEAVKPFKKVRFFQMAHKGPAFARDFGAKMAKGDILLFTDSDCIPDKNWIAEMIAPFSEKSVAGVSGTYRTHQKEIVARFAQYEIEERHAKMANAESIDFIGTFSAGYRKNIFAESGGFDTSFSTSAGEDPELSFRLAEKGYKMVFAPKAIVYHTHPDTLWKYLRQKYRNSYWRYFVYLKRTKTFERGHSYTPKSVYTEIILAGMAGGFAIGDVLGLIILQLVFPAYILSRIIPIIIMVTVLVPLILIPFRSLSSIKYIFEKDMVVGLWSPFIIMARAYAMGLGVFRGWADNKMGVRTK